MNKNLVKSKKRVKELGEVFTPDVVTRIIISKFHSTTWEKQKKFLEPSVGTGNILLYVLKKKIDLGHDIIVALSNCYGIDIMKDNVYECRKRMFVFCVERGLKKKDWGEAIDIIKRNIIVGNSIDLDIDKIWND